MAPLVTSSAINKGKTVAPKAIARRRPAAAPKPPPSQEPVRPDQHDSPAVGVSQSEARPEPQSVSVSQPAAEPQSSHSSSQPPAESHSSTQPSAAPHLPTPPSTQPSAAQPLPTPPPTQQPQRQPSTSPQPAPAVEPSSSAPVPSQSPAARSQTLPLPPPAQTAVPPDVPAPAAPHIASELPPRPSPPATASGSQRPSSPRPQSPDQLAGQKRKRPTPANSPEGIAPTTTVTSAHDATPREAATIQQTAPEVALINGLIERHEPQRAPTAQMVPPPNTPKPRAKRQKNAVPSQVSTEGTDEAQAIAGAQDDATSAVPAAKPRKPRAKRQPKSAARVVEDPDGNVETTDPAQQERPTPKPRKSRQKKQKLPQPQGEEGGEPSEGGPEEPIEDPEKHEIDITVTTMSDLTRDKGLGKQSERETKMASIDWDEVRRKRLAEAEAIRAGQDPANIVAGKSAQSNEGEEGENNQETPQNRPTVTGPRLRLDADGNLVVEEESLRIDRQAEATRNAANLVATEDDDLTRRVNQMSWINERKRDPTDRVPFFKMKSDPWSDEETDRFYEALRMFGTDFFIISKMFPPKTRRQIKLKFVREERLDPDRVNKSLAGESTVPMDLESYAEATGQDLEHFKDPRELEEELRVEGEEQRVEIARKKKEIEEAKKQRDIQMAAREKDTAERSAQRREKAALKANRRRGVFGAGTF